VPSNRAVESVDKALGVVDKLVDLYQRYWKGKLSSQDSKVVTLALSETRIFLGDMIAAGETEFSPLTRKYREKSRKLARLWAEATGVTRRYHKSKKGGRSKLHFQCREQELFWSGVSHRQVKTLVDLLAETGSFDHLMSRNLSCWLVSDLSPRQVKFVKQSLRDLSRELKKQEERQARHSKRKDLGQPAKKRPPRRRVRRPQHRGG